MGWNCLQARWAEGTMAGGTSGSFFIDCCIALFRFTTEEPFKIVDGVCCRREDGSAASPLDADGMVDDIRTLRTQGKTLK
jgi:hypothetical protein